MAVANVTPTPYGFHWGDIEVERSTVLPEGQLWLCVKIKGKRELEIYLSPAGHSLRVFSGHEEILRKRT